MKKSIANCFANANVKTLIGILLCVLAPLSLAADYPAAGDFSKGSQAWADNCARCHNMRKPSDLRDDQWITSVFHMRVRAGLTGQETRDILTFLQASNSKVPNARSSGEAVTISAHSGRQIYQDNCVACHGENGRGELPGVPDFTEESGRLRKTDKALFNSILNGHQHLGSNFPMPPKGGNGDLTEADIERVLMYIRERFDLATGQE